MAVVPILAGIQAGLGIYNSIRGARKEREFLGPLSRINELQLQTAMGQGPLIDATKSRITRGAELAAQRARLQDSATGFRQTGRSRSLANMARIGGLRAVAEGVSNLQGAALQGAAGTGGVLAQIGLDYGRRSGEASAQAVGTALPELISSIQDRLYSQVAENASRGGFARPQFQFGLPGAGGGYRRDLYGG